jgi:hypothetical protein
MLSLDLSARNVIGGENLTATIPLSTPADAAALTVYLYNDHPELVEMPATLEILHGDRGGSFPVTTSAVGTTTEVHLSVSTGLQSLQETLTLHPAVSLASLALAPNPVAGGETVTGTVTLTAPASGDARIALSSNDPGVALPPFFVVVSDGSRSASFDFTTSPVKQVVRTSIGATWRGDTRLVELAIQPPGPLVEVAAVALRPNPVRGGKPVTATVRLSQAAPAGGFAVGLASDNAAAVPADDTLLVAGGSNTGTFRIATQRVRRKTLATISASGGGNGASAVLSIKR